MYFDTVICFKTVKLLKDIFLEKQRAAVFVNCNFFYVKSVYLKPHRYNMKEQHLTLGQDS